MKSKKACDQAKKTGRNDLLLFISLILISLAALGVLSLLPKDSGSCVLVKVGDETYGKYLISEDREIIIESEGGYNTLVISGGEVYVKEASCPDKICVAHPHIKNEGEVIICLPNKVSITVIN